MAIYSVTYEHPDEDGWRNYVLPHLSWLQECVVNGSLLASGPLQGEVVRPALLIMSAPDRSALDAVIATDPFAQHGLIENMAVHEWDPIFGAFKDKSSMRQAGQSG